MKRDMEQFVRIYQAYKDDVLRQVLHYVCDYDTAEEITQNIFYNLYTEESVIREETIRSLLLRIARQDSIDYLRKSKRIMPEDIEFYENDSALALPTTEDVCMEHIYSEMLRENSCTLMQELYRKNEEWYYLILMKYYQGLSGEEIARRMNIKEDVLYSKLYRAKKWIKKNYAAYYKKLIEGKE